MKGLFITPTTRLAMAGAVSAHGWAKARQEKSPRRIECVTGNQGEREVNCSIACPEAREKAAVVGEIFGPTEWGRVTADPSAGCIALASDLLAGTRPGGRGASEFQSDAARRAISARPPGQFTADLNAVMDFVSNLPASNDRAAARERPMRILRTVKRVRKRRSTRRNC